MFSSHLTLTDLSLLGSIQIWGIEPQQKWSALAPDFTEVTENVFYEEREDEFDTLPEEMLKRQREEGEDEEVDVLTIQVANTEDMEESLQTKKAEEQSSFVLPMLYDIPDSDAEDALVKLTATTYRKKDIHEGKEYEVEEGDATPRTGLDGVSHARDTKTEGKSRRKR